MMQSGASNAITPAAAQALFEQARPLAQAAGVFGVVSVKDGRLVCTAKAAAAPASFRAFLGGGRIWVSLVMADRWLSESIEGDLVESGDKIEDLLEEELVDQSAPVTRLKVEHFRSDDLLFTFRSPLPPEACQPGPLVKALLAYEACFRILGDMNAGDDEE